MLDIMEMAFYAFKAYESNFKNLITTTGKLLNEIKSVLKWVYKYFKSVCYCNSFVFEPFL